MTYSIFCPFCGGKIVSDVVDNITEVYGEWQCNYGHTFTVRYLHTIDDEGVITHRNTRTNLESHLKKQVDGVLERVQYLERVVNDDIPEDEIAQFCRQEVDVLKNQMLELKDLVPYYVVREIHKS